MISWSRIGEPVGGGGGGGGGGSPINRRDKRKELIPAHFKDRRKLFSDTKFCAT